MDADQYREEPNRFVLKLIDVIWALAAVASFYTIYDYFLRKGTAENILQQNYVANETTMALVWVFVMAFCVTNSLSSSKTIRKPATEPDEKARTTTRPIPAAARPVQRPQ